MARTSNPNLHALWHDRVGRQAASGLTIEQFCIQEGIARSKFHAWKRRFRLMESAKRCPALPAPPARSAFLPVTVHLPERGGLEPLPIEADLPNGVRLRIPTGDPRLACRIVHAIASARPNAGGSR
jgi:hypothetical protein